MNLFYLKLSHSDLVTACVFINLVSTKAGWIEWGYQKVRAEFKYTLIGLVKFYFNFFLSFI